MSEQETKTQSLEKRSSRRTFIKNTGLTVGGVVLGGALGSLLAKDSSGVENETHVALLKSATIEGVYADPSWIISQII